MPCKAQLFCTGIVEVVETIVALGEMDTVIGIAMWEESKSNVGSFIKHVIKIEHSMVKIGHVLTLGQKRED